MWQTTLLPPRDLSSQPRQGPPSSVRLYPMANWPGDKALGQFTCFSKIQTSYALGGQSANHRHVKNQLCRSNMQVVKTCECGQHERRWYHADKAPMYVIMPPVNRMRRCPRWLWHAICCKLLMKCKCKKDTAKIKRPWVARATRMRIVRAFQVREHRM